MTTEVLISYSTNDSDTAKLVRSTLEDRQIHCRDVQPDQDSNEAAQIVSPPDQLLIVVFSSHTNASSRVQREIADAFKAGAAFIAFRVEAVTPAEALHPYLSTAYWLDAVAPPLDQHLVNLADRVQAMIHDTQTPVFDRRGDARGALQWIIAAYGQQTATDLQRLGPMLLDLCGNRKRENYLLINAAREGVPTQLTSSKASLLPIELLLSRLTQHLEENLLVSETAARWAVESWALALGRITPGELITHQLDLNRRPAATIRLRPRSS